MRVGHCNSSKSRIRILYVYIHPGDPNSILDPKHRLDIPYRCAQISGNGLAGAKMLWTIDSGEVAMASATIWTSDECKRESVIAINVSIRRTAQTSTKINLGRERWLFAALTGMTDAGRALADCGRNEL